MKNKSTIFLIIGIIILIIFLFALPKFLKGQSAKFDDFAKCLKEKDTVFFGTFWCPHCQNQKKMFGRSERYLPYVECSTPDGRSQLPVCSEKNIEGYPTWEFKGGSRETGEVSLDRLAEKTGCVLPQ